VVKDGVSRGNRIQSQSKPIMKVNPAVHPLLDEKMSVFWGDLHKPIAGGYILMQALHES
jgi:hypothetical protein